MNSNPYLSPSQEKALRFFQKTANNIFVTGCAGSGKSYLIGKFLKDKSPKTFPIVASTGAAAILVNGRTFHSFFGLGIMEGGPKETIERALDQKSVVNRLRKIEGFVLDEVSMISGSTLRAAETICRKARKNELPWGGARVIAVGDFSQLPPVNPFGEEKEWAFLDETWEWSQFTPLVLKEVMRSQDDEYVHILNLIRNGDLNQDVRDYLNSKIGQDEENRKTTYLFPRRNVVEQYNAKRLAEIKGPLKEFPTEYSGNPMAIERLRKNAPIPELLRIKKGALVMIRVNDYQLKYVNGSLGTVVKIEDDALEIRLKKNKKVVEIEPCEFSLLDANGREAATARNFPITLAYATTIHKSQGATMDGLVADLRRLWEPGQAYVALSRLRSGAGLSLTGWDETSIRVDPQVVDFHRGLDRSSS